MSPFYPIRDRLKPAGLKRAWLGLLLLLLGLAACRTAGQPAAGEPSATPRPPATVEAATGDEPAGKAALTAGPSPALASRPPASPTPEDLPIFDTHTHYNQEAWARFGPAEIIATLAQANVPRALVSSSPDEGTLMLYQLDPERIVPFLRPYHGSINSGNWFQESAVMPYFRKRLERPVYRGLGEFHLHFEGDAGAPIVRETARLAVEQGLFLHVHTGAQAVRTIFGYEPEVKILWAHAGLSEPPEVVAEMLDTYEQLWVDTSIREQQIAPNGQLDPVWRELFLSHPDRITIGSDTWVPSRWDQYGQLMRFNRDWLKQLPPDVAAQIAYGNAARLFGAGPLPPLESRPSD